MNENIFDTQMNLLCDALLAMKSREEMKKLLVDLCTQSEMRSMAQRIQVATLLDKRTHYKDIEEETLASTATISRVRRFLANEDGGYRIALERIKK